MDLAMASAAQGMQALVVLAAVTQGYSGPVTAFALDHMFAAITR